MVVLLDNLSDFLKADELASKFTQISLPRPKIEIVSTLPKRDFCVQCYKDIPEQPSNSQQSLSFRFEQNN